MSWVYRRPSDPRQRRKLVPPSTRAAVGGPQTIDGVLFTKAPTFPTGQVNLQLNGVLFARAPTFATGQVNLRLNGVLFTRAPTFPTGDVQPQPVTLAGVLFTRAPTFATGQINLQLNGVLFTRAGTFATGQINLQLNGVLFTRAGTFATGQVNLRLLGILFTRAPTFPTGDISLSGDDQTINGVLFTRAPSFATGSVNLQLNGVLFTRAPTFRVQFLDLPGTSGHFASTPTTAALDITGDIWLAGRFALADWTPSTDTSLFSKWVTSGSQRSYRLEVQDTNFLRLSWTTAGTAVSSVVVDSTVAPTVSDGQRLWVAGTMQASSGDVKFYTGGSGDVPIWVQLGSTITGAGATSIFAGTALVEVGSIRTGTIDLLTGGAYNTQIENGYDVGGGTLVADFNAGDFNLGDSDTDTAIDSTDKTWTINGTGSEIKADPSGRVDLRLLGVLFTRAPTFPAGQVDLRLNGVLFTRAPTFATGAVQAGAVTLTGVLFTRAATFPTGQVTLQLFGAATFQRAPSFATGSINLRLVGVVFTRAPTFPTGAVNAQPVTITGVLFTATVLFPTGSMVFASLTFWVDNKVPRTASSLGGDNKVAYTKLEPSVPNPL